MKAATVLEKAYELTQASDKAQILKELSALLLTTKLGVKRFYLQRAIDYIEKH